MCCEEGAAGIGGAGWVGIIDIVSVPPNSGNFERGNARPGAAVGGLRLWKVNVVLHYIVRDRTTYIQ